MANLELALSLEPHTTTWFRALFTKGLVYEGIAEVERGGWANSGTGGYAVGSFERAAKGLERLPDVAAKLGYFRVEVHTKLGIMYERYNRLDEAERQFRAALALEPRHQTALSHLRDVVDWMHPNEPEKWRTIAEQGIELGVWGRIDQTPASVYHKGFSAEPWPDVSRHLTVSAAIAVLESAAAEITAEVRPLVEVRGQGGLRFGTMESLCPGGPDSSYGEYGGWHALPVDCKAQRARTPATCNAIDGMNRTSGTGDLEINKVQFLRLEPGVTLRPHCGETNDRWVLHLGLDIPDKVTITVGGINGSWKKGHVIVFDDSFRRTVEHRGDRDRVVLAMQIANPEHQARRSAGLEPETQHTERSEL